jgi:O-antigen ligase
LSAGLWVVVEMMTGSRAGLVLFALALGIVFVQFLAAVKQGRFAQNRRKTMPFSSTGARFGLGVLVVAAMAVTIWIVPSLPAFQRFNSNEYANDVRFSAVPTVIRMVRDAFPVGIGFGSFEHVYKAYEPDALLTDSYFNQAHDDFLQLAAEAGLPGLILLGLVVAFLLQRLRALLPWLRRSEPNAWLAATSLCSLGLLMLASATDYPLRVPSMMVFAILLVVWTRHSSQSQQSDVQR